jgi:hypothetical protein
MDFMEGRISQGGKEELLLASSFWLLASGFWLVGGWG